MVWRGSSHTSDLSWLHIPATWYQEVLFGWLLHGFPVCMWVLYYSKRMWKKLLHPHPTPEKRLSCVLVYPSSGTIAYISPPPLEKKWGLQWPYSILILGLHSSSPILPPHPTPLTTTQNKRICSEVLVVSLIYWVMCTLYEMVDQPITKNWQAVAYKTAVINSCVTKC